MTRKQFIKQLMGAGMTRNNAADCATLAQNAARPYLHVLGDLLNYHRPHFNNALFWLKMRHTIIHGHNTPAGRFFANLDEVHSMGNDAVHQAIVAGMAKKSVTVKITDVSLVPSGGYPIGGGGA